MKNYLKYNVRFSEDDNEFVKYLVTPIFNKYRLVIEKMDEEGANKIRELVPTKVMNDLGKKAGIYPVSIETIKRNLCGKDVRDFYYIKYLTNNGFFNRRHKEVCEYCDGQMINGRSHNTNDCSAFSEWRKSLREVAPHHDLERLILENHLQDRVNGVSCVSREKLLDIIKNFIYDMYWKRPRVESNEKNKNEKNEYNKYDTEDELLNYS
jgi:hypothetical protein